MKISLIIPVLNGLKYYQSLKNTLEKIDLDDRFEIVVIDDGSIDHFNKLLRMEFPKVKYHYQENQGSGIARNLGIKHSTGDWLMFMDVDDVINMSELNKALNTLDYNTDIFCFPAKRVTHSAQGAIEKKWKPDIFKVNFSGPSFLFPSIIIDSIVMNKIFNRHYISRSGVKFPKGKYEDKVFLTFLFLKNPKISIHDISFYRWMVYPDSYSQTNTKDIDDITQRFNACLIQLILAKETPFYDVILSNVFNHDIALYSKSYHTKKPTYKKKLYNESSFFSQLGIPKNLSKKGHSIYRSKNFQQFNLIMQKNRNSLAIKISNAIKKTLSIWN